MRVVASTVMGLPGSALGYMKDMSTGRGGGAWAEELVPLRPPRVDRGATGAGTEGATTEGVGAAASSSMTRIRRRQWPRFGAKAVSRHLRQEGRSGGGHGARTAI